MFLYCLQLLMPHLIGPSPSMSLILQSLLALPVTSNDVSALICFQWQSLGSINPRTTDFSFHTQGCFLVFNSTVPSATNQWRFSQGTYRPLVRIPSTHVDFPPWRWALPACTKLHQWITISYEHMLQSSVQQYVPHLFIKNCWVLLVLFGISISAQVQVHIIFILSPFFSCSLTMNQI